MTKTEVLYNDKCPICSFEIKHYDKVVQRDGLPLKFDGVSDSAKNWGIDPETAAKRIHIRRDGQIIDGMPAFIIIWSQIPRYQWLARFLSLPVIRLLSVVLYDYAAAPVLHAMHKRRQRKASLRND